MTGAHRRAPDERDNADYEVGYGRPPVATRFKPGNRGNPRATAQAREDDPRTAIEEAMNEKVKIVVDGAIQ